MAANPRNRFFGTVLGRRGSVRATLRPPVGPTRQESGGSNDAKNGNEYSIGGGDPRVFEPIEDGKRLRLPPGTAVLTVFQKLPNDRGPRFGLRGVCCCEPARELGVYGQPDLDIGKLVSPHGELPVDVVRIMHTWSRTKAALTLWLDDRRAVHDGCQLVVWDDTGFRIPWELFWLGAAPESGRPAGWLGGLVTITRWLTIQTPWRGIVRGFRNEDPYMCAGTVAAYVAPPMWRDKSLLPALSTSPVEHSSSMEELASALRRHTTALAMVYVACHGEFGDQPAKCKLGEFSLERAYEVGDDFYRLRDRAAVVFLNACHSGSIGVDKGRYNDGALRGFAEVFLRAGAAGVLATNGEVGEDLAHEMARDLFEHLRQNPGKSMADAVRELREKAAHLVPSDLGKTDPTDTGYNQANKQLLQMLYRFMYVYYGSPRTVITVPGSSGLR